MGGQVQPMFDLNALSHESLQKMVDATKAAFQPGNRTVPIVPGLDVSKAAGITTALALTGYDLSGPAQSLVPVITPLRNRLARRKGNIGSAAFHKMQILGINTANVKGSVAFGKRNTGITYTTRPMSWTYKSVGLDDVVQMEAVWQGQDFEDVRARSALSLLWSVMIQQEALYLGANCTNGITVGTVTLDDSATGGITSATGITVKVVALTLQGYLARTVNSSGVTTAILTETERSASSSTTDNANLSTKRCKASWTAVDGAFAYAVFAGAVGGNITLQDVVTVNYFDSGASAALSTGGQNFTAISGGTAGDVDVSQDANAFDGIIPQIFAANNTAYGGVYYKPYIKDMNNAVLSSTGNGRVTQLDLLNQYLWDTWRIGPTLYIMNSQQASDITDLLTLGTGTGLGFRINLPMGTDQKGMTGGFVYDGYINRFTSSLTPGSPDRVPFLVHPNMPPGMIVAITEKLPFPKTDIDTPWEVRFLQDYADFEWAMTQRQYEHGIYAHETLVGYAAQFSGIIRGIKAGTS